MIKVKYFIIALLLTTATSVLGQNPIGLHSTNPHYFIYRNKPTVLITSGEHYGSLLNRKVDFKKYHATLKKDGLNMTRIFTGGYYEPKGAFKIADNIMAPDVKDFVCPWLALPQADGSVRFDLTRWDESYFRRLKDLVGSAQSQGIVVEIALFCPFYEELQWRISPFNAVNNINDLGHIERTDVHTVDRSGGLLAVQEAMVTRIVRELNAYDNVIFEICNEPYFGGVTIEWQHHMSALIQKTESSLKFRHLISQNIANDSAVVNDPHPTVSVFNFHYATPPNAVRQNYHLNRVIGDNETGFRGQADSTYRKEGWEIILAGGALYNNLDYSFTVGHEDGTFRYSEETPGGGSAALRKQLGHLLRFMNGFRFVRMRPDTKFITGGLNGARVHVLSEPGKQYAAYFIHGKGLTLSLDLPEGRYNVQWFDPVKGEFLENNSLNHKGGTARINSPSYDRDIALKIVAR